MRSASERERKRESVEVQVQFSSGCSRSPTLQLLLFSRLHRFYPLLLSRATLFPCFSLLFHPFRRCAPRSFPPRLSFFSSTSTTFRPCLPDWLHFRGQILRDRGVKPKISQQIGLETVAGKDGYFGYFRSFESRVDILSKLLLDIWS